VIAQFVSEDETVDLNQQTDDRDGVILR